MSKQETYVVTSSAGYEEKKIKCVTRDRQTANQAWEKESGERGVETFIQVWKDDTLQYVTREV